MKALLLLLTFSLALSFTMYAGTPPDSTGLAEKEKLHIIDSVENTFKFTDGVIQLGNGIATINVPKGFKFLDGDQAQYVITELWGNPKGNKPLGLLMPADSKVLESGGYAFIISFEEMGYVKDGDANDINYDDLLKDLKKGSDEENLERKKQGLYTMDLIGWAAKPYYDANKKVLYWAKEFKVEGSDINTLNYDIRILGRKGVLVMQAVAGMDELPNVNKHIDEVFGMVSYTDGNKYADFDSKTDNVAAWTIGGLVAGKVLAKAGFFAIIAKFAKFIIAGIAIAGGAIWRFITGRRKKEEEFVYQPQPAQPDHKEDTPLS